MHALIQTALSELSNDFDIFPTSPTADDSFYNASSLAINPEIEESFCRNYVCCGLVLPDMHQLIQHFEDVHIRFEDEEMTHADGFSSESSQGSSASSPVHTGSGMKKSKKRKHLTLNVEPCDYSSDNVGVSSFDNTVIRAGVNKEPRVLMDAHVEMPYPKKKSLLQNSIIGEDEMGMRYLAKEWLNDKAMRRQPSEFSHDAEEDDDKNHERPYVCTVPGCGKSYKNPNGLKYHTLHGHGLSSKDTDKPHRCTVFGCGKRYKNPNGLKYHITHSHMNLELGYQH
jgi:hypothetical protein